MVLEPVKCPDCGSTDIVKYGYTTDRKQRYRCKNESCHKWTFICDYVYQACRIEIKEKIIDMTLNSSGIRDISRVLKISHTTVIKEIKKKESLLKSVNQSLLEKIQNPSELQVVITRHKEAELDEMWSFVQNKSNQRWLWHAIDHMTGEVFAYVLGSRKDEVFRELKKRLEPFGIKKFYSDDWGAYQRGLDPESHCIGKSNTQKIERKHLTLRTRIKRLARKTICFSKTIKMHDIVMGLFVNRYEFGLAV